MQQILFILTQLVINYDLLLLFCFFIIVSFQFLVDRVKYSDDAPWPEVADGSGKTLHRCDPTLIGDDASKCACLVLINDI